MVEVDPSNFSWWEHGRGGVDVRYSRYFEGPVPQFGGVVEVYPSDFSWRQRGRGGVEVRCSIYFVGPLPHFWGCGRGRGLSH